MYQVRSASDYLSVCERLISGGIGIEHGRQTCFFTAVDPMNSPMLTARVEKRQVEHVSLQFKTGEDRTTQIMGSM